MNYTSSRYLHWGIYVDRNKLVKYYDIYVDSNNNTLTVNKPIWIIQHYSDSDKSDSNKPIITVTRQ